MKNNNINKIMHLILPFIFCVAFPLVLTSCWEDLDTFYDRWIYIEKEVTFSNATDVGEEVEVEAGETVFIMTFANNASSDIIFPWTQSDTSTKTVSNKFFIGQTEVTYRLWKIVYDWAIINGYTFNFGSFQPREGSAGTVGADPLNEEPVTYANWRHCIVWCNALTEYYNANNGALPDLDYVYYADSTYDNPLRSADDSSTITFSTPGSQDAPYIKSSTTGNTDMVNCTAKGFRLPTSAEWEFAARWAGTNTGGRTDFVSKNINGGSSSLTDGYYWTKGQYASGATTFYNDNSAESGEPGYTALNKVAVYRRYYYGAIYIDTMVTKTANVASKTEGANQLGLFDMSGNISEWCFEWHPTYPNDSRIARGGNWSGYNSTLVIGYEAYSSPDYNYNERGFRITKTQ